MTVDFLDGMVALFGISALDLLRFTLPVALNLFLVLATIQISWDLLVWVLRDEAAIVGKAVRQLLVLSFFYSLIVAFPLWMPRILASFAALGQQATGLEGLSPASIYLQGINLSIALLKSLRSLTLVTNPVAGLLVVVAFTVVIGSFALMALRLAGVLAEGALVLGGLVVFLGAAGHRSMFGLAEGYIRYAIDVGIRVFVVYLLVAVGKDLGYDWLALVETIADSEEEGLRHYLVLPAAAALYGYLVWTIPKTVSSRLLEPLSFSGHNPLAGN